VIKDGNVFVPDELIGRSRPGRSPLKPSASSAD